MACDLPLTVSADTRKAITDLDGAENAARRTEHYRSVVLDPTFVRAPAQLSANDLRRLPVRWRNMSNPWEPRLRRQPPPASAGSSIQAQSQAS